MENVPGSLYIEKNEAWSTSCHPPPEPLWSALLSALCLQGLSQTMSLSCPPGKHTERHLTKMLHMRERSVCIPHGIVPSYTCTAIEGLHFLPRPSCLNSSPPVRALARDILFWGREADFPRLPPGRSLDPLGPSSRLSAELLCLGFIGPGPPG